MNCSGLFFNFFDYYQYQRMSKMIGVLLCALAVFVPVQGYCTGTLGCFKSQLFNFNYPREGLYSLDYVTQAQDNNFEVMAYGDFNNDLLTDFAAKMPGNNTLVLYLFNKQTSLFEQNATISPVDCQIQNIFTYDADLDGYLDITVWGIATQSKQNCLVPYLQVTDMVFVNKTIRMMEPTSQPFVISYGNDNGRDKNNGLCVFENGSRVILKIDQDIQYFLHKQSIQLNWTSVFQEKGESNFSMIPFASPHWNSYLDLTGDCRADVVIVDDAQNIEIWVNYGRTFVYQSSLSMSEQISSLYFSDMDYSGTADLVVTYSSGVEVLLNTRSISSSSDFCCQNCYTVKFDKQNQIKLEIREGENIVAGASHIADIDINGYPDLLLTLANSTHQFYRLYTNNQGNGFGINDNYQSDFATTGQIISASFIDFLENGILDIMLCVQEQNGDVSSKGYFNNYLQQNYFYIKGYAASGADSRKGCQVVGASFYWVNSLGETIRMAYNSQIIQTAYSSLQLPFAYCGLGRANNYVESFTMGVLGQKQEWSPIIPNSQLAVFAPGSVEQDWQIRIFVLPTESLVYVMIVCIVLLVVLGAVLLVLKCKYYKKKEEPLMEFIH